MTREATALVVVSALITVVSNLAIRHGLLRIGGFALQENGVAGLLLRLATQPAFVLGMVGYALAAIVWFRILSIAEVSSAYPMVVGLTFCMVTVGGIMLFQESVSVMKVVGILVILLGVVVVARA